MFLQKRNKISLLKSSFLLLLFFQFVLSNLEPPKLYRKLGTRRLPNHTIPIKYKLDFDIDENLKEFRGYTEIEVDIKNSTDNIVLHAKNLDNFKIHITDLATDKHVPSVNFTYSDKSHFLKIYSEVKEFTFESEKQYRINIKYKGKIIDNDADGIYKSKHKGTDLITITTQFEAVSARKAFPCFDEPEFKATFIVTIRYPKKFKALSNTLPDGESRLNDDGTTKTTTFKESVIMSTYLVAFAVHQQLSESSEHNNITYTVYYIKPEDKARAKLTSEKTGVLVTEMEKYFGINYKLNKMDQISVPVFAGQGMENWGLIVYEEKWFLLNTECKTYSDFQINVILTHELVHQWFGNLVSPKWWTYTWLNEGFATYYSYIIAEKIFPNCQVPDLYRTESLEAAFTWKDTRPLSYYVEKPKQIEMTFDSISYYRASAIIGMFVDSLSETVFRNGIIKYLEANQFSVATEDDLFESLEKAAIQSDVPYFNKPGFLPSFMRTWTQNRGYPVLHVKRNYETGEINLTQSPKSEKDSGLWYIPVNFATKSDYNFSDTKTDYIMNLTKTETINLTQFLNISKTDWLIINKQGNGLYTVLYDRENWLLIAEALKEDPSSIHLYNRVQIIRDMFRGLFDYESFDITVIFEILSYLKNEKDLLVWDAVCYRLDRLLSRYDNGKSFEYLKEFLGRLIKPLFNLLMNTLKENESPVHDSLRKVITKLACKLDLDECLQFSYRQLQCFLKETDIKDCFSKTATVCGAIKKASKQEIDTILEKTRLLEDVGEFPSYLEPFFCSTSTDHIQLVLKLVIDAINKTEMNKVEPIYQAIYTLFEESDFAQNIILDLITNYFNDLSKNTDEFEYMLSRIGPVSFLQKDYNEKWNKYLKIAENFQSVFNMTIHDIDASELETIKERRKDFLLKYDEKTLDWLKENQISFENENLIDS